VRPVLDWSSGTTRPATYRGYGTSCKTLRDVRDAAAKDLKPLHVTRWLDAHPGWKGCRPQRRRRRKRAFNWADAEGVFQPNPIRP